MLCFYLPNQTGGGGGYEQMILPYDLSHPIEDIYKQMQDGRAYTQARDQPYGPHQISNIAYALIFNTGVYNEDCKEWEKYSILYKSWESFKLNFVTEHQLCRKQTHTSQASGFHAANHALLAGSSIMLEETSGGLAMLATATATSTATLDYRGSVAKLISTNDGLSLHLAKKVAALAVMNDIISRLRAAAQQQWIQQQHQQ
jgi:hypothetical protein